MPSTTLLGIQKWTKYSPHPFLLLTEEKDIKYEVIQCQVVLNIMTKKQGNVIESDRGIYFR